MCGGVEAPAQHFKGRGCLAVGIIHPALPQETGKAELLPNPAGQGEEGGLPGRLCRLWGQRVCRGVPRLCVPGGDEDGTLGLPGTRGPTAMPSSHALVANAEA